MEQKKGSRGFSRARTKCAFSSRGRVSRKVRLQNAPYGFSYDVAQTCASILLDRTDETRKYIIDNTKMTSMVAKRLPAMPSVNGFHLLLCKINISLTFAVILKR